MPFISPRPLTVLACALALGAPPARAAHPILAPSALSRQRGLLPSRVERARLRLDSQKAGLGLGDLDGFKVLSATINAQGEAVVRFTQTFEGRRVWGAQAIARVDPDGGLELRTEQLLSGIQLPGGPRLTPQEAGEAARRALSREGDLAGTPEVEPVVFPARFLGGLAERLDPETGRPALDRAATVHAKLGAPFVWAYEVRFLPGKSQGRELLCVVDARTGNLLRVSDLSPRFSVPTPAQGTGHGFYRGTVALDTSQMADGTFALYDTTRGTQPNPLLQYYAPDGSGWSPTGMQVWWDQHDASGASTWSSYLFQSNPVNTWGDGLPWAPSWGQEDGPNGQTAGVDAMSAMATTWDFYKKVFGLDGPDGLGTTVFAQVLTTDYVNADDSWWDIGQGALYLGAGSYPGNPQGRLSMTDLDIVAHEMTHGVTSPNYSQYWVSGAGFEEAGLNEATSDFFAQMVKAYASRGPGAPDDAIPDTGADWEEGAGVNRGTPIRWMDKPSRDQHSVDGWHDGLAYMDGHYSSGPLNRALYFLCNGASSVPGDDHTSVYLPGGMAGIGNDKAARIWFKAVTEGLLPDGTGSITYADARDAAIQAAVDLYGSGSPEETAVESAFSAVNVGLAPGQASRVSVRFEDWRNGDYIETSHFTDYANRQIFPKGETVRPRVSVTEATDASVDWSLGGPSLYNGSDPNVEEGGVLHPDGTWTTPNVMGWHAITATSHQNPNQLAEGRVFLIDMDTDMDLEQDAVDMAGIAYSWQLSNALNPAHSVFNAPWVDDTDVSFFVDAMRSAWPAK